MAAVDLLDENEVFLKNLIGLISCWKVFVSKTQFFNE